MRLRAQLLLVSLLTLVLPWAGWQYAREMESVLRRGQEDALLATAGAVASLLDDRADLLYRHSELLDGVSNPRHDVYARRLQAEPSLDGYSDDWSPDTPAVRLVAPQGALTLQYLAGVGTRYLYLHLEVKDDDVTLQEPVAGELSPADALELAYTDPRGMRRQMQFATAAPGAIAPQALDGGALPPGIQGEWQATRDGYNVEVRVPLRHLGARFGFAIINASRTGIKGRLGSLSKNGEPGLLVFPPPELEQALRSFAQPDKRLRVTDRSGRELARVGELELPDGPGYSGSLLQRFYRAMLGDVVGAPSPPGDPGQIAGPSVDAALAGRATTNWIQPRDTDRAVVAAAQPIRHDERIIGTVLLEQTSDAILTLTNQALARLINFTLLASSAAALALLGYATLLSLRIRRLRDATEHALGPDGLRRETLPGERAGDELGDLSRSFATLLSRVREYTEYLRTLASKLSHELRTPLAVVESSLENLDRQQLTEQARVYADRARQGSERLRLILTAMSEARRVEESIEGADWESFDLKELIGGSVAAYRDVYPECRFATELPSQPCPSSGAPELLVQLLDKLIDNAVDFTPRGGTVDVRLRRAGHGYRLSVDNEGPLLPERMQHQLFDSMVSLRERSDQSPHLGLGLYIARLIVEFHGGTIRARNRADGRGVEFRVELPPAGPRAARATPA